MVGFRSFLDLLRGLFGSSDEKVCAEVFRLRDQFINTQSPEEQDGIMAKVRRLAQEHPEAVLKASESWENRWAAEYEKVVQGMQGKPDVDLSSVAAKIREQMAWPQSGSVKSLPGASEELATALDYIEAHNGKVPGKEAVKIIAALDAEGPEARYLSYRAKKNLPPL